MIIGNGCDLAEVARIAKAIERKGFLQRVFTPKEIAYCESRGQQRAQSYAARFAAKEAVLKALGTGLRGGSLLEIEIENDALGKPQVQVSGYFQQLAASKGGKQWELALSHVKEYALAHVILAGSCSQLKSFQVPSEVLAAMSKKGTVVTAGLVKEYLPVRPWSAHKGLAGKVVVCAGSPGFAGAAALASYAAVKTGAGLVTLLTTKEMQALLAVKLTEVMVKGVPMSACYEELNNGVLAENIVQNTSEIQTALTLLEEKINEADAGALGPGWGTSKAMGVFIRQLLTRLKGQVVLDADVLTALVGHTEILRDMTAEKILTPHAAEMARLIGSDANTVNANRIEIAREYAEKWQATVVLKGAPTVIAFKTGAIYLNSTGNAGMATGGAGDVLTGVIAALLAQTGNCEKAALAGVYLHGLAGDLAAALGPIGITASEISEKLPQAQAMLMRENVSFL